MTDLFTMFATFVAFVSGVVLVTEAVNKLFKVKGQTAKLIVSWVMSIGLAALGFGLQLGIFADLGSIDMWQGWVKTALVGLGAGWCANYMYDRDEMWTLLELIFSLFGRKKK